MRRLHGLATLIAALAACGTTESLVRITQGGELVEVDRQTAHSIIEVRSTPPGSVASSLFILRGSCAVARARGKPYFRSQAEAGPVRSYRLTFPDSASSSELQGSTKTVFSLAECELLRF